MMEQVSNMDSTFCSTSDAVICDIKSASTKITLITLPGSSEIHISAQCD